jgi:hypothetical protein
MVWVAIFLRVERVEVVSKGVDQASGVNRRDHC